MKTKQHGCRAGKGCGREEGSALLVAMCLAGVLIMSGITLTQMATQATYSAARYRRSAESLALAEAGVADILEKMAGNYDAYKSYTITRWMGNGSYTVRTRPNGQTGAIITSSGIVQNVSRVTVLETLGTWNNSWDKKLFGTYGIVCGGSGDLGGIGHLFASLYSDGSVGIGPNTVVEGDVFAVGTVDSHGEIGGETNQFAEEIEIPTFNFEYYWNRATDGGGFTYTGDQNFKNATWTPPSGLIAVRGNVTVANSATINGAIVASGNVEILGGTFSQPAGTDLPSVMSTGGRVDIQGGHKTFNGFIYAATDVILRGENNLYGGVIAGGTVTGNGTWNIYPGDGTIPPGINPGEGGEVSGVRIGGWLR